jgi:hypothetical protein
MHGVPSNRQQHNIAAISGAALIAMRVSQWKRICGGFSSEICVFRQQVW